MRSRLRGNLFLGIFFLFTICVAHGWPSLWGRNKRTVPMRGEYRPAEAKPIGFAVFELEGYGGTTEQEGLSKTFLMKEGHLKAKSSPEGSCWHKAYAKLLSSCSQILQDEEKKSRLAFEFMDCFLRLTGWHPPCHCPGTSLVRFCTEKFDEHTHNVYLKFFVETTTMCYNLQSEAFRKETRDVVNDLQQTGHEVLHKVKEVKDLSEDVLMYSLEQSERLQEKLTGVESLSQSLLMQGEHFGTQLKGTLGAAQAVYDISSSITTKQKEIQQLQQDFRQAVNINMQELHKAAVQTNQQLQSTAEGYKELGQQQVELTDALIKNVHRFEESAFQSLNEVKDSETRAMEETRLSTCRASLKDLTEGAQRAQESFLDLRTKVDDTSDLLYKSSSAILKAQEAFAAKLGSILSTVDRMFSLYDSFLYESRAFKLVVFYGTALVFVHVLSSAKQTNHARAYLNSGLCLSMALELYISRAYSSLLQNQQSIEARFWWIRAVFVVFSAAVILYCMAKYRDLSSQNHHLLLQMHRRLGDLANKSYKACYLDGPNDVKFDEDENVGPFSLQFMATAKSLGQALASKILHRAHKFVRRQSGIKNPKHDALRVWVRGSGLDTFSLRQADDSSLEDEEDPDYECSIPYDANISLKNYNLRSSCRQRAMCRFHIRRFG